MSQTPEKYTNTFEKIVEEKKERGEKPNYLELFAASTLRFWDSIGLKILSMYGSKRDKQK